MRTFICESCQGPMRMTETNYRNASALGHLVYCNACKLLRVPPKRISGHQVRKA